MNYVGTWDTNKSTPPQLPVVNSTPKSMVASTIAVRPGWAGPPAQRQAPPTPRPQHPIQTYQPQGNTIPPPHLPPQVGMPAGCATVFVSNICVKQFL